METQLTVRLPEKLERKLAQSAKRLGIRRSDLVRMALEQFLEQDSDDSEPYEKVKHLIGSYESGLPDLGTEHRKHLIKRFKRAQHPA